MANIEHKTLTIAEQHVAHFKEYANASARTGASGLTADDDGKIALQTDDNSLWILTDYSGPTWQRISFGTALTSTVAELNILDGVTANKDELNLLDGVTVLPKQKIVELGDWDMDATTIHTVAHGLTLTNIRDVNVMIRNDGDSTLYPLNYNQAANESWGQFSLDATDVNCYRIAGAGFDSTEYNSTSYNRGWATIWYVV